MKSDIRKCPECKEYTLQPFCPNCGVKTSGSAPPRFSPEDKYGDIRREEEYKK